MVAGFLGSWALNNSPHVAPTKCLYRLDYVGAAGVPWVLPVERWVRWVFTAQMQMTKALLTLSLNIFDRQVRVGFNRIFCTVSQKFPSFWMRNWIKDEKKRTRFSRTVHWSGNCYQYGLWQIVWLWLRLRPDRSQGSIDSQSTEDSSSSLLWWPRRLQPILAPLHSLRAALVCDSHFFYAGRYLSSTLFI